MKIFLCSLVTLLVATSFVSLPNAHAQPLEDAGKAHNPTAADLRKAATEQAMAQGREVADKVAQMTPAQLRDYLQELQEELARTLLTQNGFTDLALQELIVDYLREQNRARWNVRVLGARVRGAIANQNTTEVELSQLMAQWQKTGEEEKIRSEAATLALRETLKLGEHPRLDAVLHLNGLVGNEGWLMSNALFGINGLSLLPTREEIEALPAK